MVIILNLKVWVETQGFLKPQKICVRTLLKGDGVGMCD